MTVFTTNGGGGGSFNVVGSYAGPPGAAPVNGNSDTVTILNGDVLTVDTATEGCLSVTINAGGVFTIDVAALGAPITWTWDDAANNGIIAASAGAFSSQGTVDFGVTVNNAGGQTPGTYWNFEGGSYTVTADYTTFEGFIEMDTTGAVDIDNCAFQYSLPTGSTRHGMTLRVVTSFTNITCDNLGNTTNGRSIWFAGDFTGIDNITVTNPRFYDITMTTGRKVEMLNSSFDATNCYTGASGIIVSDNHDVAGDFYVILGDADTVGFSEITTEPGATDTMFFYLEVGATLATFQFDEAGKSIGGISIQSGEAITIQISVAFTIQGTSEELYILVIDAGIKLIINVGLGADSLISFYPGADRGIVIGAAAELEITGSTTYNVYLFEHGTAYETAPTHGIQISFSGILDMDHAYFYHIALGSMAALMKDGDQIIITSSIIWFVAASPFEIVVVDFDVANSDFNFSRVSTYDRAPWTLDLNGANPPTGTETYFDNLHPSIWEPTDGDGMVFWQMPSTFKEKLPSVMEVDATNYAGGENVPVERSHITRSLFKGVGRFTPRLDSTHSTGSGSGYPLGGELGYKQHINILRRYYIDTESDLRFIWQEGIASGCQIVELDPIKGVGVDATNVQLYDIVVKGIAIFAE